MKRALPFLFVATLVALYLAFAATRPRRLDPRLRVEREGTQPFDAEALYRLLPEMLGAPVEPVEVTPFERLADTTLVGTAYVFATGDFSPGPTDTDRLIAYAARGNTVVVAAETVSGPFAEALGDTTNGEEGLVTDWTFHLNELSDAIDGPFEMFENGDTLHIGEERFAFPVPLGYAGLVGIDSARTAVVAAWPDSVAAAVAVTVGQGRAVVLSTPLAMTNAVLAGKGDGPDYLAEVFAYVPPVRRVLWDDTFKPLRQSSRSMFRYALRSPALRGALVVLFLGALLGVVNLGRRRQRPIPVVAPPPNAQREFARTVGRLFFVRGDRRWLAQRKIRVFLDALRSRLGLPDADLSDRTAAQAAARTGTSEAEAFALFARLRDLDFDPAPDPAALLAVDRDTDALLGGKVGFAGLTAEGRKG